MSDHGSEQSNTEGAEAQVEQNAEAAGSNKSAEIEAAQKAVEQMQAKIKELETDNYKYRQERKSRKTQEDDALKKAGEYEPILQERESKIGELESKLEGLTGAAEKWEEFQAAEAASIEADASELPQEDRDALAAVPDLRSRRRLLDRLKGPVAKQRPPEVPAGAPAQGSTDFASLRGAALVEAIKTDPTGWQSHVSKQGARPMTDYQRRQALQGK